MKIEKEKVLKILYNNIVKPAVDEDDTVLVDYRRAYIEIMMEGEHDEQTSTGKSAENR